MKKKYIQPAMEVVDLKTDQYLLTVSDPGFDGGSSADPEAPEFDFDWVKKAYEFGGWDIE